MRRVALHLAHRREASGPLGWAGELEADVRRRQGPFGPHHPLGDGRSGYEEGTGDVLGVEAADQLQGEGRARIRGQDRVGGHEDQAKEVVCQVAVDELGEVVLHDLRTPSGHQVHLVAVGVPPSDPVDG